MSNRTRLSYPVQKYYKKYFIQSVQTRVDRKLQKSSDQLLLLRKVALTVYGLRFFFLVFRVRKMSVFRQIWLNFGFQNVHLRLGTQCPN